MEEYIYNEGKQIKYGKFSNSLKYYSLGESDKIIIFLMGGPGNSIYLRDSENYHTLLNDLIVSGYKIYFISRKMNLSKNYTFKDQANDFIEAINQDLNGKVECIIGYSYGGIMAYYIAEIKPEISSKYIILGAAYRLTNKGINLDVKVAQLVSRKKYRRALWTAYSSMLQLKKFKKKIQLLLGIILIKKSYFLNILEENGESYHSDMLIEAELEKNYDMTEIIKKIDIPILLIGTTNDVYFTEEGYKETAELLKHSKLHIVKDVGHAGLLSNKEVLNIIKEYITKECENSM